MVFNDPSAQQTQQQRWQASPFVPSNSSDAAVALSADKAAPLPSAVEFSLSASSARAGLPFLRLLRPCVPTEIGQSRRTTNSASGVRYSLDSGYVGI